MTSAVSLDDLAAGVRRTSPDPLARLTSAVLLAERLGRVADDLIGTFVDESRRAGSSWTEIGRSMGVTRQAAQKRFVARTGEASAPPVDADRGFGQFTPDARDAVMAAHDAARAGRSALVTPAHLLLGLLRDGSAPAPRALAAAGPALDAVRAAATAALPPAAGGEAPEIVPYDEAAQAVLQAAFAHAGRRDDDAVGGEHVLLALRDDDAGLLAGLGVDPAALDDAVTATRAAAEG
jgi:Clp amino terminal domain, pathogenicity island component